MLLRDLRSGDWPEVARIFEEGIRTGNATFETEVLSWEAWDAAHLPAHRLVAERDGRVVGWIALVPVSPRECYAGVAEVSAYVAEEARGEGVGRELLGPLIESGLCHVYLGVESGDDQSLLTLNNLFEAEGHARAGRLLR